MSFPTNKQIVWLARQRVSMLNDKQLREVLEIAMQELMIRKGEGRIYLVDGRGNDV